MRISMVRLVSPTEGPVSCEVMVESVGRSLIDARFKSFRSNAT